jgi:hypothetical protein
MGISIMPFLCYAQSDFFASQNGAWNVGTTWGNVCATGCSAGVDYPGPNDNAYTERFSVRIPGGTFSVNNLYVAFDTPAGITKTIGTSTLIIRGQLAAYNPDIADLANPTVAVVINTVTSFTIQFTGDGLGSPNDPVITSWSSSAPLRSLTFNPASSSTTLYIEDVSVANNGSLIVQNGILEINPSNVIQTSGTSASITVNTGTTLNVHGAINGDGAVTSRFPTITVNGTLTTGALGYVNASNFSLGANATLNIGFYGANQTEGWWYGTARPDNTFTLNSTSTVNYLANQSQSCYAANYGNLQVSGSGTITKTVAGSGSLNIASNLLFSNSGITLNSSLPVVFNGTNGQAISGGGSANFNGGLEVNKTSGTFSLSQNITVQSGITVSQGTFDASNYNTTLSGNITNNGTLSFGTGSSLGTLTINGSTVVSGTSTSSLGNITVNSTRSFTCLGSVNIAGNVSNSGTFTVNSATFNGTSSQNLSGTLSLTDIAVSNTTGVANNGTIDITGVLTMSGSGVFDADGSGSGVLTLKSSGLTTTARIATLPNPSLFTGNVTVERFVDAPEDWRYLAMPVLNGNVGMWQDDFPVTGNFSNPSSGGNVLSSAATSIYYWNAPTQAWTAVGSGGSTNSTSLSNTVGYSAWTYLSSDVAVDVRGDIGKGSRAISLSTGDNLIPNPYPSGIDWDNVNLTGANLTTQAIYVRTGNNTYASYVPGGPATGHPLGGGWGGELALGQAFWVLASSAGTLTFQEDDKVGNSYYVRESSPRNYLRIRLSKDGLAEGVSDDVVVHFKENATIETDIEFDARKKINDAALNISLYNTDPAVDYAINGVPLLQCEYSTKIKLGSTNSQGNYSLRFEDLTSIDLGYEILLIDKFLNIEQVVSEGMNYPFTIDNSPGSAGADRFEIKFKTPTIDSSRDFAIKGTNDCNGSDDVKITIQNTQPGVYYSFVVDEVVMHEPVVGTGQSIYAFIERSKLSSGNNVLALRAATRDNCYTHNFPNAFVVRHDAIMEINSVSATVACNRGVVVLKASGAPADGKYHWYESKDSETPIPGAVSAEFTTPTLEKTRMYFVTAVNPSGCESLERLAVEAKVVKVEIPEIVIQGDVLVVPEALGSYQWYRDHEPIHDAIYNEYKAVETGTYTVMISANNCSVSAQEIVFVINDAEDKNLAKYTLYPNPVHDKVIVTGRDLKKSSFTLFDETGKPLHLNGKTESKVNGEEIFVADFNGYSNGIYLLNIRLNKELVHVKIIKR